MFLHLHFWLSVRLIFLIIISFSLFPSIGILFIFNLPLGFINLLHCLVWQNIKFIVIQLSDIKMLLNVYWSCIIFQMVFLYISLVLYRSTVNTFSLHFWYVYINFITLLICWCSLLHIIYINVYTAAYLILSFIRLYFVSYFQSALLYSWFTTKCIPELTKSNVNFYLPQNTRTLEYFVFHYFPFFVLLF